MPAPDSGNRRSPIAALALGLALVGAASMLYYQFGLFMPRVQTVRAAKHLAGGYAFGNDFYPIWLTSRQWLRNHRDPYSPAVTRDIQIGLFGRPLEAQFPTDPPTDYRTFAYPAFADLLLWPASEVPFPPLRVAWVGLLAALTAASVFFWTQALSWRVSRIWQGVILLLTLVSYPALEGLYAGQLGLVVGFLLAACLLALVRGRLVLAGILMALTTIKPQMTLLAILYLLTWSAHDWRRRGRFSVAFLATMFLLIGASLAVWPHWIQSWGRVILGYHRYAMPPLAIELLGSSLGPHSGTALITIALLAALVLAWRCRAAAAGSYEFWLTLSLLLAITAMTLLPGQAVHDHVILLPGIFLLACRKQPQYSSPIFRALCVIGTAILLWPWVASLGLIALRPFLRPEQFYSKAVFVLPLRTAAPFPFVVLGLLAIALRAMLQRQAELVSAPAPPQ
ncbi:MAG: glycosyltransferase family 87 protein [Candidatus Sulfotelmatobacter sp.]